MIVYILGFVLTAFFAYYAHRYYLSFCEKKIKYKEHTCSLNVLKSTKRKYILFLLIAILPLGLISGLRYGVGTDYFYTYSPNFYKILNGESPYSEIGFNLLNRFLQLFTHKDTILFLFTGILFSFLLVKTIVKYSNNIILSFVVALISCIYFISLNNVRQSIASVIMLASFPYFVKKETWKVVLCTILGIVFHYISFIILITYIICNVKFVRKNFTILCVLSVAMLPIISMIFEAVMMHTKYYYYFVSDFNNNNKTTSMILFNSLFFILYFVRMNRYRMTDRKCYIFLVIQFLAFWFSLLSLFVPISELISRIVVFFVTFHVLSVPYMGLKTQYKSNRLAFNCVYISSYTAYMVYYIIILGYHAVLPYQSIFGLVI